jgi:serine/threonine protein kinase
LHSRNVIHGDLKGVRCPLEYLLSSIHTHQMNILVEVVDKIPHARLADFGIATVTKNLDSIRSETRQDVHTPRWSAPEIIREHNPTKESDVYSFAMVMIEVHRE